MALLVVLLVATAGGTSRPAAPPPDRPNKPAVQAKELAQWLRQVAR